MKKLYITILILFSFIYTIPNTVSIGIESGMPMGIWSYELNNIYGISFSYMQDFLILNPSIGIILNSFDTGVHNYNVNSIKIPFGLNIKLYKKDNYTIYNYLGCGFVFINKSLNNFNEYGYCEFIRVSPYFNYNFNNKSFDIYLGYERQKILNGNNLIFIGINIGFILY